MAAVKVLIGVPTVRAWHPYFGCALNQMICYTARPQDCHVEIDVSMAPAIGCSNLPNSRQALLNGALKGNFTHMLMLDDDMCFPRELIVRLLAHRKDVVCPNACQKVPDKINGVCLDFDGKRIDSSGKTGLERVRWGTVSCLLVRLDPIRAHVPQPHFEMRWREKWKDYEGEDHYFFNKLHEAGLEIWCDHDMAKRLVHLGDYPYRFTDSPVKTTGLPV